MPGEELIIKPAIAMGLVIGIIEMVWVMKDEVGPGKFGHALHTLPLSLIFIFISMNSEWVIATFAFLQAIPLISNPLVFRIVLALVAGIKAYASSRLLRGTSVPGTHESIIHVILYMGLIVGAPYIWTYLEPMAPAWLK